MLPLTLFRNRQFSGANLTTLAVYAALGGAFFLLVLQLQLALGYSALEAGSALLPVTLLMVSLSSRAGAWAQRIGPRLPMTIGPIGVAAGLLLWTRVGVGATYVEAVLPGAVVFGLGLACTVAPLTATIMASADGEHLGAASGVNNAIARLAGLLAVTILPIVVSLDVSAPPAAIDTAVNDAMVIRPAWRCSVVSSPSSPSARAPTSRRPRRRPWPRSRAATLASSTPGWPPDASYERGAAG